MNKLGKIFIGLGSSLLIFSGFLIIFYKYEDKKASLASKEILTLIEENLDKELEENQINNLVTNINNQTTPQIKAININGNDYIGTISIPKLNLTLPLNNEFNYDDLKLAPCIYYGSILTNDLIICGHSYKAHFKYLNTLNQSDIIIITDTNNIHYLYEVLEVEVLESNDVLEMIDNDFDLTLYTCTPDSTRRITVRCNRIYE